MDVLKVFYFQMNFVFDKNNFFYFLYVDLITLNNKDHIEKLLDFEDLQNEYICGYFV